MARHVTERNRLGWDLQNDWVDLSCETSPPSWDKGMHNAAQTGFWTVDVYIMFRFPTT